MYTVFYYLHLAVFFFFNHFLNPLESFYSNVGDVSEQKIRQILSDYKKVFSTFQIHLVIFYTAE